MSMCLTLRDRTGREASQHWLSIMHAVVMLTCADWQGQVVQRKQQELFNPSRAAALAPARRSMGLAKQRAVERTHGRGTALCCHEGGHA